MEWFKNLTDAQANLINGVLSLIGAIGAALITTYFSHSKEQSNPKSPDASNSNRHPTLMPRLAIVFITTLLIIFILMTLIRRFSNVSGVNGDTEGKDFNPIIQEFDGIEMVFVPNGCFIMGNNEGAEGEQSAQEICFNEPFWIDKTEVTQADFNRLGGQNAGVNCFEGEERPVECVSWFEAADFCELRNARLPTEAEWEFAARGPDNLIYPWGENFIGDNVVYSGNSNAQSAVVGSRPDGASWVGALDLAGNVWEWTSTIDSTNDQVLRGGSWGDSNIDAFRTTFRNPGNPADRYNTWGFRCVRAHE